MIIASVVYYFFNFFISYYLIMSEVRKSGLPSNTTIGLIIVSVVAGLFLLHFYSIKKYQVRKNYAKSLKIKLLGKSQDTWRYDFYDDEITITSQNLDQITRRFPYKYFVKGWIAKKKGRLYLALQSIVIDKQKSFAVMELPTTSTEFIDFIKTKIDISEE
jgi:hypothetical protein